MAELLSATEPGRVIVKDLWERFRIYHNRPRGIKDRLFRFEKAVYEDFWALKGVSFEVNPGESFAVIGANGSGKSTLLKCLARILPHDRGIVEVGGKVASLLELGAGFHGDLSGRENVYLNGSILGIGRRQMERMFDEIVDFAGVGDFIDNPVRNYSSGMYVRLGFAVAINVDPDVLLVDEILAVGDAAFQSKCFEKMHDFKRQGKTLVLVTHDLGSAERLCDRAALLDHGELVDQGPTRAVVDAYRRRVVEEQQEGHTLPSAETGKRWGTGGAEILEIELLGPDGNPTENIASGDKCTLRMLVKFKEDSEDPVFGYKVLADSGVELFTTNSMWRGTRSGRYAAGDHVEIRISQRMNLLPFRYLITAAIAYQDATRWYDWWDECVTFHVNGSSGNSGYVDLEADISWERVAAPVPRATGSVPS